MSLENKLFTHPFQKIVTNKNGDLLFALIKDTFQVYSLTNDFQKIFEFKDSLPQIIEKETETTKVDDDGKTIKKKKKKSSNYQPNKHQLENYEFLRAISLSKDEQQVYIISDFEKSVIIFNITYGEKEIKFDFFKKQSFPKRPNCLTSFEENLYIGDKFGDVYHIKNNDASVIKPEEMKPILGHVGLLTNVEHLQDESGKNYLLSVDRDEHLKLSHLPQSFILNKFIFGHKEFISTLVVLDSYLISAGGDDFIMVSNWKTGEVLDKYNYLDLIKDDDIVEKIHNALPRFQKEGQDTIREFCISQLFHNTKDNKIIAIIEGVSKIFVFDFENGKLVLNKTTKIDDTILSVANGPESEEASLIYNTNNQSETGNLIGFVKSDYTCNNEKTKAFNNALQSQNNEFKDFVVTNEDFDLCPIYFNHNLRKHADVFP